MTHPCRLVSTLTCWDFCNEEHVFKVNVPFLSVLKGLLFFRSTWQDVLVCHRQVFGQMVEADSFQSVLGWFMEPLVGWVSRQSFHFLFGLRENFPSLLCPAPREWSPVVLSSVWMGVVFIPHVMIRMPAFCTFASASCWCCSLQRWPKLQLRTPSQDGRFPCTLASGCCCWRPIYYHPVSS